MAGSYNRIILVGNLTRDPEIRYVQSGNCLLYTSDAADE